MPCCTQTEASFNSSAELTFKALRTMKPCPSKKLTAAKSIPSEVSRDMVQVVLRDSTSISPDCRAVKRFAAVSGTNLTLVGSLKIAAAMARQKSTSNPTQLPCESGMPKPARVPLAPQISSPRSLTVLRVCDHAVCVANASVIAMASAVTTRFMIKPFSRNRAPEYNNSARPRHVPAGRHLRTIALLGQGVDETVPCQGNGANGLIAYSTRKTQE